MDRIWVANSLIADPALSKGKPDASTEILLEELVNVTKVTLQVEAQTEPGLYAKKALTVPPWDYDIDLGIPAQVSRSEKIGVAFALPEGMAGYRLRIQNQELNLPTKLELTEGEYIFQLSHGEFGQPSLAGSHTLGSDFLFAFDHFVNLFLQCSGTDELMHHYIFSLPDAVGPVGGLIFHRRIPPAVEMHHMRACGQV